MKFKAKIFILVLLLFFLLLFWFRAMIVDNIILSWILFILLFVISFILFYIESRQEIKIESEVYSFDDYDEFKIKLKKNILSNKYVQIKDSGVFVREYNDGKYHIKKKLFFLCSDKYNEEFRDKLNKEVESCIKNNKKYKGMKNIYDRYIIQPIFVFNEFEDSLIDCGYMYSDFPIFDSVWMENFVPLVVDKKNKRAIIQGMTGNSNQVYNYNQIKKILKKLLKEIVK